MKIKYFAVAIYSILLLTLFGFNKGKFVHSNASFNKNNIIACQDSVMFINNSNVKAKTIKYCSSNIKDYSDNDFLNTTIKYFNIDIINKAQLSKEIFYRNFLTKTHFLEFEESDFYDENFSFSLTQSKIKNYGKCYVSKYYFPNADNSAQRRAILIINVDKNEISIWNFDNVNVVKDGLKCDFNVRGKHKLYKMIYSFECDRFVYL